MQKNGTSVAFAVLQINQKPVMTNVAGSVEAAPFMNKSGTIPKGSQVHCATQPVSFINTRNVGSVKSVSFGITFSEDEISSYKSVFYCCFKIQ